MESYFESSKNKSVTIKILLGIIILLLIINVGMFKSVLTIAGDKTFKFEVPSFLESGEYAIGTTFASKKVYKMWTKIWVEELANFSHEDVRERVLNIMDFLDPTTAYKNKASLLEFVNFVEENFVSQEFSAEDFKITKTNSKGYYEIKWSGKLEREIGTKKNSLSGLRYTYVFTCFTRNGQIYINNLELYRTDRADGKTKKLLKNNKFVNYDIYMSEKQLKKEQKEQKKQKKGESNEK